MKRNQPNLPLIAILGCLFLIGITKNNCDAQININVKVPSQLKNIFKRKGNSDSTRTGANANTSSSSSIISTKKGKCLSGDCTNGFGVKQSVDYKYEGNFKDGIFDGDGTYTFLSGRLSGTIYKGQFSSGTFNGHGREIFTTSKWFKYYDGDFVNGVRQGVGTFVAWNNDYYRGQFLNDQPGGFGIKTKYGFPRIGYYDDGQEIDGTRGLTLDVVKKTFGHNICKICPM